MGGATPERIRPGGRNRLGPLVGTDWFRLRWGGFQGSPRLVEGRGLRLSLLERKERDTEPSVGRIGLLRPRPQGRSRKLYGFVPEPLCFRRGSPLPLDPFLLPFSPFTRRPKSPAWPGGAAGAPGPGRSAYSLLRHGAHRAVPHRGGPDRSEEGRE